MADLKFSTGDRVRLKESVKDTGPNSNSRRADLINKVLIVDHYHNSVEEMKTIMCRIENDGPSLWLVGEEQIERI